MAYKTKVVKLEKIVVEDRSREELGDIESLAESIKDKGLIQPLSVKDMGDGRYKLLAGGRRYAASTKAGLKEVPVLIRERLEDQDEDHIDNLEIELIENVFRLDFSWAERSKHLKKMHDYLKAKNKDWSLRKTAQLLNKGLGTVSRDLQLAAAMEVMPELGKQETQDQALKLLKNLEEQAIVEELRKRQQEKVNAVFTDGSNFDVEDEDEEDPDRYADYGLARMLKLADANYRIGDVFKGLEELRDNGVVHLIECDPPYGIDLNEQKRGKEEVTSTVRTYNEIPSKEYGSFLTEITQELYRVAGRDCWLIFWYGPTWHSQVYSALVDAGWQVDPIPCIWYKKTGQTMQPSYNFARTYEPFFLARKGNPAIIKQGRSNVFEIPPTPAQKKYHPTERPIALMEELIASLVVPGSVCLVPFAGSGVTLRACYKLGVNVMGWDLNPEYKDKFMLAVEADTREINDDNGS